MRVFDCFPLCWELTLLEIRLSTLDPVVDFFVIAESPWLRSGEAKPLYYREARDEYPFNKYKHKIIHVVEQRPPVSNRQVMEWRQKNIVSAGIKDCLPDDLIFVSDADEIWRPEIIDDVVKQTKKGPVYLDHQLYYYFFNNRITNSSKYSSNVAFACRYRNFTKVKHIRRKWKSLHRIKNSGWHYAYLMSPEGIREKIRALGVAKYRAPKFQDLDHIRECMRVPKDLYNRKDLYDFEIIPPKDMDAPPYVMNQLGRFEHFLYPGEA